MQKHIYTHRLIIISNSRSPPKVVNGPSCRIRLGCPVLPVGPSNVLDISSAPVGIPKGPLRCINLWRDWATPIPNGLPRTDHIPVQFGSHSLVNTPDLWDQPAGNEVLLLHSQFHTTSTVNTCITSSCYINLTRYNNITDMVTNISPKQSG